MIPLTPEYFQPRKAKEKLVSAQKFLQIGKKEIRDGRARSDPYKVRQGAEKVFHALTEACAAIIQKYGIKSPERHRDALRSLEDANELGLWEKYRNAFNELHHNVYYKGWVDVRVIDKQVKEVEEAIRYVEKKFRR